MAKYKDFGKYCTYADAIFSATALRHGLTDNTPTEEEYENMILVYLNVIQPVGDWIGVYPGTNSFYRSDRPQKKINGIWHSVNSIVGGSKTSDHPNGRAWDGSLRQVTVKQNNIDLAKFAVENIDYDQIILEAIDPLTKKPAWVHIGYRGEGENRHELMEAKFANGKPKYSFLK